MEVIVFVTGCIAGLVHVCTFIAIVVVRIVVFWCDVYIVIVSSKKTVQVRSMKCCESAFGL